MTHTAYCAVCATEFALAPARKPTSLRGRTCSEKCRMALRRGGRRPSSPKRKRPPVKYDHAQVLKLYGMTPQDYADLLQAQGGGCAICGGPPVAGKNRLAVDHDHKTNMVRGLLCQHCNLMLGLAKDDIQILLSAVEYLQ